MSHFMIEIIIKTPLSSNLKLKIGIHLLLNLRGESCYTNLSIKFKIVLENRNRNLGGLYQLTNKIT